MAAMPSPAGSPSLETMSRKRMRSTSGSSIDSASSNKRSLSEVPSTSGTSESDPTVTHSRRADFPPAILAGFQQLPSPQQELSQADIEIDEYMAEQDHPPSPNGHASTSTTVPSVLSPAEKYTIINTLKKKEMVDGESWFVVSHAWYRNWEVACGVHATKEVHGDESSIPPVNNDDIADENGNLSLAHTEGVDVEFLPEQAWEHLEKWYGKCSRPLLRRVITQGLLNETRLELFPLQLKAYNLVPGPQTELGGTSPPHVYVLSKTTSVGDLENLLAKLFSSTDSGLGGIRVRYWHIQGSQFDKDESNLVEYPVGRLRRDRGKLLDTNNPNKSLEDALIEQGDAFVVERKTSDGWICNETPQVSRAVTPLFGSGSGQDFFSKLSGKTASSSKSADASQSKTSGFGVTRVYSASSRTPGTTGLVNLGNTCFMNSAIQSLAHEPELTEYFLTGLFREELNPDNPLGMQGAVAEAFGVLLSKLWVQNSIGSNSAYSPREFKQVLARFAPSFSGYQQQDAQEFLAFVLDGLHEDLNRIFKKPYVEKPEWEGGGDDEQIALARKSWEGYMLRNDSVIVDLFQGQYKSTLVCPECSKVSITFDPFMYLTLPLPVRKKWKHQIYYVPWDLSTPHVLMPVELPQNSTFRELKQLIARWRNTPWENLLTLEIWSGKFYKNMHDGVPVQDVMERDVIVCFELPCNSQQSRNYERSKDDPIIVPVFHATTRANSNRPPIYNSFAAQSGGLFGNPLIAVFTQEEVKSVECMYGLVIDRLSRWTTQERDLYTWQGGASVSSSFEQVIPLKGASDSVTEIRESGEVVTVEESDITEMSTDAIVDNGNMEDSEPPQKIGPKPDIFKLCLHAGPARTPSDGCAIADPLESPMAWETRAKLDNKALPNGDANANASEPSSAATLSPALLKNGDWIVCEWDVHMQNYYFGRDRDFEHARWHNFDESIHPEYAEAQQAAESQKKKSLTIEDCLDEFTREEQLGQDDLWYCPRCKKHQQATKKFDIWKVPDVLVVHLKRFSSSRMLRDKIDALVEFPIEGLDLEARVGERLLARKLQAEGRSDVGVDGLDEHLLYDLFAVTEHMGGLGGGHYRAYAKNHLDSCWYHFDDSHVSKTSASQAVNANAYLLFYRRRTTKALGGKTHEKIKLARTRTVVVAPPEENTGLPTPPQEGSPPLLSRRDHPPLPEVDQDEGFFMPKAPYGPNPFDEMALGSNTSLSLKGVDYLADSVLEEKFRGRPSPTSSNDVELDSDDSLSSPPSDNLLPPSPLVLQNSVSPAPIMGEDGVWKEKPTRSQIFSRLGQTEPHGDVDDIDL